MSVATVLVGIYPAPVRRLWGDELRDQLAESGPRSWVDAVVAAAGLWLHPALWPETRPGERRRVLAVFAMSMTMATALVVRATGTPVTAAGIPALDAVWPVVLLAGVLGAAPLPRLSPGALRRLIVVGVRTLSTPAVAGLAIVGLANSPYDRYAAGPLDPVFVTAYWLTLVLAAHRACVLIGRTAGLADPPGPQRIRASLTLIGTGIALAVADLLVGLARSSGSGSLSAAGVLAALAVIVLITGRDLRAVVA